MELEGPQPFLSAAFTQYYFCECPPCYHGGVGDHPAFHSLLLTHCVTVSQLFLHATRHGHVGSFPLGVFVSTTEGYKGSRFRPFSERMCALEIDFNHKNLTVSLFLADLHFL